MRRISLLFCSLAFLLVFFTAVPQGTAFASGGPGLKNSPRSATVGHPCYDLPEEENCNHHDPYTELCNRDQRTAYSFYITDGQGRDEALIVLEYSPHCQTNWTHAYAFNIGTNHYFIDYESIARDDGLNYQYSVGGQEFWTDMVFAPVRRAQACASIGVTFPGGGGGGGYPAYPCTP